MPTRVNLRPEPSGEGGPEDLLARFLGQLESSSTRRGYRSDLNTFIKYLLSERLPESGGGQVGSIETALEEGRLTREVAQAVQEGDVLAFLRRESAAYSEQTARRRATALRTLFEWLLGEGAVAERPLPGAASASGLLELATGGPEAREREREPPTPSPEDTPSEDTPSEDTPPGSTPPSGSPSDDAPSDETPSADRAGSGGETSPEEEALVADVAETASLPTTGDRPTTGGRSGDRGGDRGAGPRKARTDEAPERRPAPPLPDWIQASLRPEPGQEPRPDFISDYVPLRELPALLRAQLGEALRSAREAVIDGRERKEALRIRCTDAPTAELRVKADPIRVLVTLDLSGYMWGTYPRRFSSSREPADHSVPKSAAEYLRLRGWILPAGLTGLEESREGASEEEGSPLEEVERPFGGAFDLSDQEVWEKAVWPLPLPNQPGVRQPPIDGPEVEKAIKAASAEVVAAVSEGFGLRAGREVYIKRTSRRLWR